MIFFFQNSNNDYMCRKNYERIYTRKYISGNPWIIRYIIMSERTFHDDGNVLYLHRI